MSLFFMRHAADLNPLPGVLTSADVGLNESGKEQALLAAKKLQLELGGRALKIITSPRLRALEHAAIVRTYLSPLVVDLITDNRLAERDCSTFDGQRADQVFKLDEATLVKRGMEPYDSLYARSKALYDEIMNDTVRDTSVLLVSHSSNVGPWLQVAGGLEPDTAFPTEQVDQDDYLRLS